MDQKLIILTISDFIVPFILVPVIIYLYGIIKAKNNLTKPWDAYFLPGFFIRVFSTVLFSLLYQYYFKIGDTFIYYQEAVSLRELFYKGDFQSFFELVFLEYRFFSFKALGTITHDYLYFNSNNHILIGIAGLCNLICFNSYISIAIIFATFGYVGTFYLYRAFCSRYPAYYKQLGLILIFFPTTFFWSSGLMKEPLCIGALSFIIWSMMQLKKKDTSKIKAGIVIILNAYLLVSLKSYIFYTLVGGFIFASLIICFYKIPLVQKYRIFRWSIPMLIVLLIFSGVIFLSNNLMTSSAQLIIGEIANTQSAQLQASISAGGSGYSLSDLSPTPTGIIAFFTSAMVTSFFRPWPWEINKPILLINGFETIGTILFIIWMIWKIGISNFIKGLTTNLLATTLLLYTLLISITIATVSFNFGTLVRYKAPMLGFFFLAFYLIFIQMKSQNSIQNKIVR